MTENTFLLVPSKQETDHTVKKQLDNLTQNDVWIKQIEEFLPELVRFKADRQQFWSIFGVAYLSNE